MPPPCFDVVYMLLVVVSYEARSSTKSSPVCPVRPFDAESGPQGDCQCSVLDEIQCRGLFAVPEVDVMVSYVGRRTYRSLYIARQHIGHLPAAAFAALNVRRIVLDFNPIGDRIDSRAFRGTVDVVELARLGLVSRRRRTSHRMVEQRDGLVGSSRRQYFNASARNIEIKNQQLEVAAAEPQPKYVGNRRRLTQTASKRDRTFNASAVYNETGRGKVEVAVPEQSRRDD